MTYEDALKFFKSGQQIGEALGVSASRVSQCKTAGGFSYPMQCVLEKESKGSLKANRQHDPATHQKSTAA